VMDTQRLEKFIDYDLNETEVLASGSSLDYWREARGFWYPL